MSNAYLPVKRGIRLCLNAMLFSKMAVQSSFFLCRMHDSVCMETLLSVDTSFQVHTATHKYNVTFACELTWLSMFVRSFRATDMVKLNSWKGLSHHYRANVRTCIIIVHACMHVYVHVHVQC